MRKTVTKSTKKTSGKRAALYLRVSTKDGRQDTANQRRELEKMAAAHKFTIVKIYTDQKSGKDADRPAFQRMKRDAELGHFDVLLFWGMDRLSREGTLATLKHLQALGDLNVDFISYTERYLDTCGIMKDVVISLLATLAKQERIRYSERTKAALDRKREDFEAGRGVPGPNGYILGGRPEKGFDLKMAKKMRGDGYSLRAIAEYLKLPSHSTVRTKLAKAGLN